MHDQIVTLAQGRQRSGFQRVSNSPRPTFCVLRASASAAYTPKCLKPERVPLHRCSAITEVGAMDFVLAIGPVIAASHATPLPATAAAIAA